VNTPKFETVEVPFKTIGDSQCLTVQQAVRDRWIAEFIAAFPAAFEYDVNREIYVFHPNGDTS
jgi:hypothetical protein